MDIRQLQCFAAVASMGSYTRAADALFLTRQALSKTVKQLEGELGFPLFAFVDGKLALTEQGRRFQTEIGPTLEEFAQLASRYGSGGAQKPRRELALAMAHGFFDVVDNDILMQFLGRDEGLAVSVEESHGDGVLDMVRTGAAEVGLLGSHPMFLQDFEYVAIAHPGYHLLVPLENPLADRTFLELGDLDGQPLVTLGSRNHLHRLFMRECERAGVRPDVRIATSEFNLRDRYLDAEAALAFSCSPTSSRPNVPTVCLPLCMTGAQIFGTYAIRRPGAAPSAAARDLWEFLERHAV